MGYIAPVPFEQEAPDIKEWVEDYWTKRADGFFDLREAEIGSSKYGLWETEIMSQLERIGGDKAGERSDLRILDVGCGCGFFEIILTRHGYNVTGIDLTPSMIEKSKLLAQEYGCCEAEFLEMDAEGLDFEDNSFDVVISRNLTWTLPHPQDAYQEWLRVLKPGGLLLNYDAEYAKDHHKYQLPKEHAHNDISSELEQECHKIYHMLSISSLERPAWDVAVLTHLGMQVEPADTQVGARIYAEKDRFYIPNPMFRIKAVKKG